MTKTGPSSQYTDVSEHKGPPGSGLGEFDAIYDHELDYVLRTLGRLGVPASDLDDAAHDVFLVLYRRWHEIDRERAIRPWLFGVSRRVAADLRAKRREPPTDIEPSGGSDTDVAKRDLLWRAMASLEDDRRIIIILHDLEGHTGSEIAAILDISANTVHSRLRLARADLVAIVRKLEESR